MIAKEKYVDETWDFKRADTKTLTHCYHSYPAMMIPQIAEKLLTLYGQDAKTLFDPYCGTGTSLVEANVKNINAVGIDLNPLACLIAKTKTTKIDIKQLDYYLKEFSNYTFSINFGSKKIKTNIPTFKNIDFWFGKNVQVKLAEVKNFIDSIKSTEIKNFFSVAFSETVRECSYTRNSEFKLYRMKEKKRVVFEPDVFAIFQSKLTRNKKGLETFLEATKNTDTYSKVLNIDTTNQNIDIPKKSIDILITSPPYGDSRTTVAYGQFSRLANQWLGFENAAKIDNALMGGKPANIKKFGIKIADLTISKVADKDEKRAREVFSFYNDYFKSISNISTLLKTNCYACYVVGNRKVKGITLPTDEITKSFFEQLGFIHEKTIVRNIPSKKMPSKNSPTNITGKTDNTMNKEYIVIMKNT